MRIAIVGAGAGGLAAAYDLARQGHTVVVFEGGDRVGGLASGFRRPGWAWTVERFYHHWFQTDQDVFCLIKELGATDQLRSNRPVTALWYAGKAHQFDSPLALLRFPGLSPAEKLRMGAVLFGLRHSRNWQALESVTAHEWLLRHLGRRAYEAIWEPLLVGKFSEAHYRSVNMAWFWARIHSRTQRLWTFEGGFQAFLDLLAERCIGLGADIRCRAPVLGIEGTPKGGFAISTSEGWEEVDACVVTGSPQGLLHLAPVLPEDYLQQVQRLRSVGAIVLLLILDRPLTSRFYWTSLPKSDFPFLVLVEHTHFIPAAYFGGSHLVYCGDYAPADHKYFTMPPDRVFEVFSSALKAFNPEFDPSWIRGWELSRTPYAQPIPTVNYSANIPPVRTPCRGLYWVSMSHVYPWDRGTSHAVRLGREAAAMLERDLGQESDKR